MSGVPPPPLVVTAQAAGVRIGVRVVPRAPRAAVGPVRDGRLIVRVTAPPVDGAANDAVVRALAGALDVPRRAIRITSGETSRNKTVVISGLGEGELRRRLGLGGN
jgi:hypothetical protein